MTDKEELIKAFETLQNFCKSTAENMERCDECPIRESCYRRVKCILSLFTKDALKELEHD